VVIGGDHLVGDDHEPGAGALLGHRLTGLATPCREVSDSSDTRSLETHLTVLGTGISGPGLYEIPARRTPSPHDQGEA